MKDAYISGTSGMSQNTEVPLPIWAPSLPRKSEVTAEAAYPEDTSKGRPLEHLHEGEALPPHPAPGSKTSITRSPQGEGEDAREDTSLEMAPEARPDGKPCLQRLEGPAAPRLRSSWTKGPGTGGTRYRGKDDGRSPSTAHGRGFRPAGRVPLGVYGQLSR